MREAVLLPADDVGLFSGAGAGPGAGEAGYLVLSPVPDEV